MPARSEREVLVEYATRDEETLSLALSIAEAQDDICTQVIVDFLTVVVETLSGRLGDHWGVSPGDPGKFPTRYARFLTLEYRPHPGGFIVILDGDESRYPKQIYAAVRSVGGSEHYASVKQHLDEVVKGKVGEVSLWYRYLDARYSGWGSAATTTWLYRKGDAVEYVVSFMEELARAVERGLAEPIAESA